jgi:hypothetical protein
MEEVERYIDEHGKRPPGGSKNAATKQLAGWIGRQLRIAKPPRKQVMKDDDVFSQWEAHLQRYSQHYNSGRRTATLVLSDASSSATTRPPPEAVSGRDDHLSRMHAEHADWLATHSNVHLRPDVAGRERVLYSWRDALCIQQMSPSTGQRLEPLPDGPSLSSTPVPPLPPVLRLATPMKQPSSLPAQPPVPPAPPIRSLSVSDLVPVTGDIRPPTAVHGQKRSAMRPVAARAGPSPSLKRQRLLVTAERTAYLLKAVSLTPAEDKELDTLLGPDDDPSASGDTYNDHGQCSPEHAQWKDSMNGVFLALLTRFHHPSPVATTGVPIHVVYLDGPQLGTTRALRRYPLLPDVLCPSASPRYRPLVLYVANDSPASADSIQASGLVDHVSRSAVNEALTGEWREAPFAGAYVDLCTGTVATLLATLERLFCPDRPLVRPFVLGYTLTARDPHGQPMDVRVLAVRKWLHAHPRFTGSPGGSVQGAGSRAPPAGSDRRPVVAPGYADSLRGPGMMSPLPFWSHGRIRKVCLVYSRLSTPT